MVARYIRFGSMTARLLLPDERYGHDVAYIFGTSLQEPDWRPCVPVAAEILFEEGPLRPDERAVRVPDDSMVLVHHPNHPEIHTEALSVLLRLDESPAPIRVRMIRLDLPHFDLCVHLAVVFHKLLFMMDRVVLHGAAIRFDGKVCLFVGDKGTGKSTIALKLARAGGAVLGEDHLVLRRVGTSRVAAGSAGAGESRRAADCFLVSGCDERSRLTAKTEAHFFDRPLEITPRDFAGTMKKEVPAARLFESMPYTDIRPDYLFFPYVKDRIGCTRLSSKELLLELMRATGKLQRFVDGADRARFLDFLGTFAPTIEGYKLELSEALADLDEIVALVRELPVRGA